MDSSDITRMKRSIKWISSLNRICNRSVRRCLLLWGFVVTRELILNHSGLSTIINNESSRRINTWITNLKDLLHFTDLLFWNCLLLVIFPWRQRRVDRWRGGILRHFGYIEAGPSRSWSWLHYLMSSWEGEWEGNGEESIVFPLKYINQLQWREFSSIWKVLASDNSWAWVENNLWTTTNGKIPQWSAYGYRWMRSGGKWTRQCPLNIWNECWTLGEIA